MMLRWSIRSGLDIDRLYLFLAQHDQKVAQRAIQLIRDKAKLLLIFPELGPVDPLSAGKRSTRIFHVRFGNGAYVIRYYLLKNGDISILRIWHSREQRH